MSANAQITNDHINFSVIDEVSEILGDRLTNFIDRYIDDTKTMLSAIDIARSAGQDLDIVEYAHTLKSSSFQAGASQVSLCSKQLESFLQEHLTDIHDFHHQTRLDVIVGALRDAFFTYQDEIKKYL